MLGSKLNGLPINLTTDVNKRLEYEEHQKLCIQNPGSSEGGTRKKKNLPQVFLGVGIGGQKMFVVLARQPLALHYLIFCEHLWTPHCG